MTLDDTTQPLQHEFFVATAPQEDMYSYQEDMYSYRTVQSRSHLHAPALGRRSLWSLKAAIPSLTYLTDKSDVEAELEHWNPKEPVGFDLEWDPTFVKGQPENPVALIQLACRDRITLIQLPLGSDLPPALTTLLRDPAILKVGVGIAGDVRKLLRDNKAVVAGAVDLSHIAQIAHPEDWPTEDPGKQLVSLARLTQKYLQKPMTKGKVQRSKWSRPLGNRQLEYAANDAYAAIELLYILLSSLDDMSVSKPYQPKPWERALLGSEHNQYVYTLIRSHLPHVIPHLTSITT